MFFKKYRKDILVAIGISGLVILLNFLGVFNFLENKTRDILFIFRGSEKANDNIVVVAIDDKSIDIMGQWPFRRKVHAEVIRKLKDCVAKIIGFDVGFYDPSNFPEDDMEFSKAIKETGCVVLNSRYIQERSKEKSSPGLIKIEENKDVALEGYLDTLPMLLKNSLGTGLVNPILDDDGFWRKTWILQNKMLFEKSEELIPHFSIRILEKYLGLNIQKSSLDEKNNILYLDKKKIQLANDHNMYINYVGGAKSYKRLSYVQLLKGRFLERRPDYFKNKIVLIGATAYDLHDIFYTPYGQISGVEINANILDTVLRNRYLRDIPITYGYFLIFLISLFSSLVMGRMKLVKGIISLIVSVIIYFLISLLYFIKIKIFILIIPVLFVMFLVFIVRLIEKYFFEEQMKRKIKGVFTRYVSPQLVEEILKNSDKLELGGKRQNATIFFSDIKGFTTLSEKMSPTELVELLNEYFTEMVDIVFKYNGMLDKYIGDALMAVFGVPITNEKDPENAVKMAWEMNEKMAELRERWQKEGKPSFYIRMGICTGEVLVGNIGSSKRMEYATIGDTVNTASRLEEYNKEIDSSILIDEETYLRTEGIVKVKPVGEIKIRGKDKPIKAYELVGIN